MSRTLRNLLNALAALVFILSSVSCVSSNGAISSTETASQAANGPTPMAETLAAPTEVVPSMENLPAEWAGRIDRVETMTEMDGVTQRTVAILKSDDPGKEARLRTLQWDADAGEWVEYVPQVGKISNYSESWNNVGADDLPVAELQARMNQERVYGKDGQEIELGVVADFSDATIICADVVENYLRTGGDGSLALDRVVATTLPSGDIELIYIPGGAANSESTYSDWIYQMESIDPQALWENREAIGAQQSADVLSSFPPITPPEYWTHMHEWARQTPYRRIVFGIPKNDYPASSNDIPAERQALAAEFARNEVVNTDSIYVVIDTYTVMSAAEYKTIR